MLKKIVLTTLASASALFAYHSAEINLNNLDLGAKLDFDIGQFNENVDPDTTFVGISYLNSNRESSLRPELVQKDVTIVQTGFLKRQALKFFPAMSVGIGVRMVGAKVGNGDKDDTYVTIPLGVELEYNFPISAVAIYAGASAYYSPQVLSFYDAKNYKELNSYLAIELIPTVELKVGYRAIDFNYSYNINRSAYAGLVFDF